MEKTVDELCAGAISPDDVDIIQKGLPEKRKREQVLTENFRDSQ